jgi:hypothetical protein
MIIRGNPAGSVGFWSNHLLRDDTNARVTVQEIRGVTAVDLPSALREMQAVASGSRCHGDFMYQANINPYAHEHLTPEQWREAVDLLEKNLGLDGHQRVVVEHVKEGRQHYHVIWNRVDVETMRVADMGGNYRIHTTTQAQLDKRFGLTPTPEPTPGAARAPELYEVRAAERSGIDAAKMREELTALWNSTDSGRAFAAGLEERGYILAKGDRRDFCVIDAAGAAHSLARRLDGVRAAQVRERMADIDREALPSVAEARAAQRSVRRANEAPELCGTTADIRMDWRLSRSGESFVSSIEDRGYCFAKVSLDEAHASHIVHEFAKQIGNFSPEFQIGEIVIVNGFGRVYRLDERATGSTRPEIDAYISTLDRSALVDVTTAREVMRECARDAFISTLQADRPATVIEQFITQEKASHETVGALRAALFREGLSFARVDEAGIAGLRSEAAAAFAAEDKILFLPDLKEAELVVVNRFGGVHRLNPTKVDLSDIERIYAAGNSSIGSLSDVRAHVASELSADAKQWERSSAAFWSDYRKAMDERVDLAPKATPAVATSSPGGKAAKAESKAVLGFADAALGVTGKLLDLVADILSFGMTETRPDPADLVIQRRKSAAALENIRDDIEQGRDIQADDVRNLSSATLENIRAKGDDYLIQLVRRMEEDRQREQDFGRVRER